MEVLAWLSEKKENGKVLSKACNQRCILDKGELGKCGIRVVGEDGNLYLTTYGLAAAYNVDPVEKTPLSFLSIYTYFVYWNCWM